MITQACKNYSHNTCQLQICKLTYLSATDLILKKGGCIKSYHLNIIAFNTPELATMRSVTSGANIPSV